MTTLTRRRSSQERVALFTRSWPSAAAWGTGLVQAALGAGAIVAADTTPAAKLVGGVLVACGLALLAWGAFSLRQGRSVAPRRTLALVIGGVLAIATLLLTAPGRTSVAGAAVGLALLVVVGASCAVATRRDTRSDAAPRPVSVTGLLVAAAVIAVLVTPALAGIQDAVLADDHGIVPVIPHHG